MAYQPVILPTPPTTNVGLRSLADSIRDYGEWQQERQRHAAEKKRQREYDFRQAYATARNMAKEGDIAGAQAMMAPFADDGSMRYVDEVSEAAGLRKELGGMAPEGPRNFAGLEEKPAAGRAGQDWMPQQPFQGGGALPDQIEPGAAGQQAVADLLGPQKPIGATSVRGMQLPLYEGGDPRITGATQVRGMPLPVYNRAPQEHGPTADDYMAKDQAYRDWIARQERVQIPGQELMPAQPVSALDTALAAAGGNGAQALQSLAQNQNRDRARRYLEFAFGGQKMTIDPDQMRDEQRQREEEDRARIFDRVAKAMGGVDEEDRPLFNAIVEASGDVKYAFAKTLEQKAKRQEVEAAAGERTYREGEFNRQEGIRQGNRLAAQRNAAALGIAHDNRFRTVPDTGIYGHGGAKIAQVIDEKKATEINRSNNSYASLMDTLDALEKSYEQGRVNPLGEEAQKRNSLKQAANIAYKNLAELGALTGPDMALIEGALGKGGAVLYAADPIPAIRQAKETLTKNQQSFMDTRGLPGEQIIPRLRGKSAATAPSSDRVKGALDALERME